MVAGAMILSESSCAGGFFLAVYALLTSGDVDWSKILGSPSPIERLSIT